MRCIKWDKLFDCALVGIFLSSCIVGFILVVVACDRSLCLSFEFEALVITFILLVIGITYWAYKNNILDD